MPLGFMLVMAGMLALAKAGAFLPAPAAASPQGSAYQSDCTYNGVVKSCAVLLPEDPSTETDNTVLIHWLDGDITSVWFLSGGSMQVGAKVILNRNKRGRITQALRQGDGRQRLHVRSETGNQLSFIVPPAMEQPPSHLAPTPLEPSEAEGKGL